MNPNECERFCVHCQRMTLWRLCALVAGKKFYTCLRCDCVKE